MNWEYINQVPTFLRIEDCHSCGEEYVKEDYDQAFCQQCQDDMGHECPTLSELEELESEDGFQEMEDEQAERYAEHAEQDAHRVYEESRF